jgi:plastocyanin
MVILVAAASAVVAGTALATRLHGNTTGVPGTYVTINVRLGDKTLVVSRHASTGVSVIGFRIKNVGTKKHNFIIGDRATNAIAPGQLDDFAVEFDDFGTYLYRCTLNCAHSERGYIKVKRGNFADNG